MGPWMQWIERINAILWNDVVLLAILAIGLLFTVWTRFGQLRSLTHGVALVTGRHARAGAPGAITHFQALATALSGTVGLGNIAGVALAVSVGGPGAVFWMWVTGFVGMALKSVEVSQAMLYRRLDDPQRPRGGAMWVARHGFGGRGPGWRGLGAVLAGFFCVTLLVSAVTGGNMFQAWNVADITWSYFGVPRMVSGGVVAVLVALVILGGIRRIGQVTERLVPFMCLAYLGAGSVVLFLLRAEIPAALRSIFVGAFSASDPVGPFLGGGVGWAFLKGMQRALFSNEAGQGSSPIAHSAARTDEPISEGIVAGLEPFIDTLVVCSFTALVLLVSGQWRRPAELALEGSPRFVESAPGWWQAGPSGATTATPLPATAGVPVFAVVETSSGAAQKVRGRMAGSAAGTAEGALAVAWEPLRSTVVPRLVADEAWLEHKGATLTAKAFDSAYDGLGRWIVPLAVWLFAISTILSWSYYGEQGILYLLGERWVVPYRLVYSGLVFVATTPLIRTEAELDLVSVLGTGLMLFANVPILLMMAPQTMRAYHRYVRERMGSAR